MKFSRQMVWNPTKEFFSSYLCNFYSKKDHSCFLNWCNFSSYKVHSCFHKYLKYPFCSHIFHPISVLRKSWGRSSWHQGVVPLKRYWHQDLQMEFFCLPNHHSAITIHHSPFVFPWCLHYAIGIKLDIYMGHFHLNIFSIVSF